MPDVSESCAKDMQTSVFWGMPCMIKMKSVEQRAKAFADNNNINNNDDVVVIMAGGGNEAEEEPDYRINAKLTVRFPSIGDWNKNWDTMRKNPFNYLHINPKISNAASHALLLHAGSHPESTLKESMRRLFEQAPTDGDVTFIVGKQKQRILAHGLVVRMATPRYGTKMLLMLLLCRCC